MTVRTWLITGVSSGFGRELTEQLLARGERVVGTVRRPETVADLAERYADTFRAELLDVTEASQVRDVVERSFTELGRVDVVVSNAGYGLFGAAEELSDEQVEHIVATNLLGSINLIRAALPHLRAQRGGRVVQMSTYGGQVAFPGNSLYHATKWGVEGFAESVAQEVAPFGIGVTIVEPGGARTEFRYGSAQVAEPLPAYDDSPAHSFLAHARPQERPRPRRPGPHGGGHHRERRPGTGAAAPDARFAGARQHPRDPARAGRRLRGPEGTGRLDRLSGRRVGGAGHQPLPPATLWENDHADHEERP